MKKPLKFFDYKILKGMTFNELNRWLLNYYLAAYEDGFQDSQRLCSFSIEPDDCEVAIDGQSLYDIISSVKGIGEKRADEIMSKLKEAGVDSTLWED